MGGFRNGRSNGPHYLQCVLRTLYPKDGHSVSGRSLGIAYPNPERLVRHKYHILGLRRGVRRMAIGVLIGFNPLSSPLMHCPLETQFPPSKLNSPPRNSFPPLETHFLPKNTFSTSLKHFCPVKSISHDVTLVDFQRYSRLSASHTFIRFLSSTVEDGHSVRSSWLGEIIRRRPVNSCRA